MVSVCSLCDFQLLEVGEIDQVMLGNVGFGKKIGFYLSNGKLWINIEQGNFMFLRVFCESDLQLDGRLGSYKYGIKDFSKRFILWIDVGWNEIGIKNSSYL